MKAQRWAIVVFTLMPTHAHCTRHSKPHQETIGQFDPYNSASPKVYKGTIQRTSLPAEQECEAGPQTGLF
jgi:hypothetical protein